MRGRTPRGFRKSVKSITDCRAIPPTGSGKTRLGGSTPPSCSSEAGNGERHTVERGVGFTMSPSGTSLDNFGVVLPPPKNEAVERRRRRKVRHARRAFLWSSSALRSIRGCGKEVRGGSTVGLRLTDGRASLAGLQTCSSHACPVCSSAIAYERKEELGRAVRAWEKKGGSLLLLTLTMRHHQGNHLKHMWDALSYAWGAVSSGRRWVSERKEFGLAGFVRAVELMVKPDADGSWERSDEHLHTHILLFVERTLTPEEVARWESSIVHRWTSALARKGLTALPVGQDLRPVSGSGAVFADYFTKQADYGEAVALEMTHGAMKTAKSLGSRPPFAVLDEAIKGDPTALGWWNAYEKIQRGRRRLLWSHGLRELLEIGRERSDEEIAEEEKGGVEDTVLVFTVEEWRRLVFIPWRIPKLLDTLERFGVEKTKQKLDSWGIGWLTPPPIPSETKH